jgi:anti-anti-sigma factor
MSGTADLVDIQVRVQDQVPVGEIRGELDASNVDDARGRLVNSVAADAPGLVLDLGPTMYLDSAGVRILFELARLLRSRRQELRISVPPNGIVRRVLVLTALADVVPLHESVESAVDAVRTRM